MKYALMRAELVTHYPLRLICNVLAVSRGGYYAWLHRPPAPRQQRQAQLRTAIGTIHATSRQSYGSPRIHATLHAQQVPCCVNTVAKLMRGQGLQAYRPRPYRPQTTDSGHGQPVCANHLARGFSAPQPNRKWVCDLTYIPTGEGWLYLAAVLDLYSRKIVGWAAGDQMGTELCLSALRQALAQRQPGPGLLHHSDRGIQYASAAYQGLLRGLRITGSMSRKGNCYDNAVMESFWSSLKREHVARAGFVTRTAARASIGLWIEGWYNRQRRHSALGYQSPEQFEARGI